MGVDEWVELVLDLNDFFDGDHDKIVKWIKEPNPMLGNASPISMMELGRAEKLLKFVKQQLSEN